MSISSLNTIYWILVTILCRANSVRSWCKNDFSEIDIFIQKPAGGSAGQIPYPIAFVGK